MINIKTELTNNQKLAVEYTKGPLLIVAGPGSGKTKVLTQKGIFLIEELEIDPKGILMTTFTIKASEEIRQRIESNTSKDISNMFIGTVHSFCENIIKQYGGSDFYSEFQVLDDFRRYLFVKRNLKNLGLNLNELKRLKRVQKENELIVLLTNFYDVLTENLIDLNKLKHDLLAQEDSIVIKNIVDYNLRKDVEINIEDVKCLISSLTDSYHRYESLLKQNKYLDFCHLESIAWRIIESDSEVLNVLQNQYRYVLIDEFQDINPLQWKILSRVAERHRNITCVGDRNQSIYGFRGANPNIFDQFEKEYPDAKRIELGDNFRSKKDIVFLASRFLEKRLRKSIDLKPVRMEKSDVFFICDQSEEETSRKILTFIRDLKDLGRIKSYGDVAVLFRSLKYHGQDFIKLLNTEFKDIPYSLYGGSSFLENEEIRSILYLLAYVFSLEDRDVVYQLTGFDSLYQVFQTNLFDENDLDETAAHFNWNVFFEIEDLISRGFSKELAEKIVSLNHLRDRISEKGDFSIQNVFYELLGILQVLSLEESSNKVKILYNLGRFSEILEDFTAMYDRKNMLMFMQILHALPENVNLNKKTDEVEVVDTDALSLMNIHQAKGLEFPVVIIPSLTSRRFPKVRKNRELLSIPKKFFLYEPYDPMQEEENLFFVAMTRARDLLLLSYFHHYNSGMKTRKSSFFECLEDDLVEFDDDFEKIDVLSTGNSGLDVKLIDYSAISTFVDCPERFKINYLYGFKAQEIFMQKIGIIYHNALAKVNMDFSRHHAIPSDSRIEEILDESWIDLGEDKNKLFRLKIKAGLKRYVDFISKDLKQVIAVEHPVNMIHGNIRIRGRADFLYMNKNNEIVLMDYKSRKLATIEDTHVDLQLRFYADALKRDKQVVDKAVAYPLEEERLNIDDALISVDDGGEIERVLKEFVSCVQSKKFEGSKRGTRFCRECPYRFMCKYFKKVS